MNILKLFLALAAVPVPVPVVEAHLYMAQPVSRQFWQTVAFQSAPTEYCPHCYNFRGIFAVRERGGGGPWPHLRLYEEGKLNTNGNYMETSATSARHVSPCGDPVQTSPSDSANVYGLANSNYPVLTELQRNSEFQVKIVVSTHHWGHVELNLCDASGMEDMEVTHECLSKYPLDRASAEMEPPIDPLHPGRYFLDPPCRSAETDQSFDTGGAEGGDIVTMTFKLPPVLTCDRCVLQMMYYVSNACVHPGYATFESDDWPSGCAPTKHDWISEGMAVCGTEGSNYVEEFASCADISIVEEEDDPVGTAIDSSTATATATATMTATATATMTATATTYADDDDDDDASCDCSNTCVDVWKQCGGDDDFGGGRTCCEGATCVQYSDSYSQCLP
ncbi:unnamed protein product [Ectocarpus fasciculatus]